MMEKRTDIVSLRISCIRKSSFPHYSTKYFFINKKEKTLASKKEKIVPPHSLKR